MQNFITQFKHNIRRFAHVLLIILLFSACSPLRHVTIDLIMPAKNELPDNIQSLTLVNRAVDCRFEDNPSDTIQLRFFESQFTLDSLILDIPAADSLLRALGNLLFESGRYDIVIPKERFLKMDTLNTFADSLSQSEARQLTRLYNTDAVLSLDYFTTGIKTDFFKMTGWDSYVNNFALFYHAEMKIGYTALFRIYFPGDSAFFINSFFISDTLTWDDVDPDIKNLFRRFTFVKEGMSEAGIAAALRLSQIIAPIWEPAQRTFFTGRDKVFQATETKVMENDWESALQIWLDTYNKSTSRSLKSKLEYNIALGYEMLGNISEAIIWAVKSYEHTYRPVTYDYLNILKDRKSLLLDAHGKK